MCQQSEVDYIEEDQMAQAAEQTTQWHLDRIDQSYLPLNGQDSPNNRSWYLYLRRRLVDGHLYNGP